MENIQFLQSCEYRGYYQLNDKWYNVPKFTIKFQNSNIYGYGTDEVGDYEIFGKMGKKIVDFEKKY